MMLERKFDIIEFYVGFVCSKRDSNWNKVLNTRVGDNSVWCIQPDKSRSIIPVYGILDLVNQGRIYWLMVSSSGLMRVGDNSSWCIHGTLDRSNQGRMYWFMTYSTWLVGSLVILVYDIPDKVNPGRIYRSMVYSTGLMRGGDNSV